MILFYIQPTKSYPSQHRDIKKYVFKCKIIYIFLSLVEDITECVIIVCLDVPRSEDRKEKKKKISTTGEV